MSDADKKNITDPLTSRGPIPPPFTPPSRDQVADALRTAMAQCGQACLRWRASLDRKGRSLAVCGGLAAVALLAIVIAVSAHKPNDDARNPETLKGTSEKTSTPDPSPQSTAEKPAKQEPASEYQDWLKEQAKTFQPNGLTEVEKVVDGKKLLYIYYQHATVATGPVSELANYMQEEASRRDSIVQRKAIAEASGRYDEVIVSEIAL